jgi:outer membrane protein assembly factor BamB
MTVVACLLPAVFVLGARGADWPGFLGPAGANTAPDTSLIHAFAPTGPTVLWTVPLGPGFGGPAVRDGQVFILDREGASPADSRHEIVRCLDLASGKELWTYAYAAPGKVEYDGTRSTPAVDAQAVYTIGVFGQITAVDRATHTPRWSANLVKDFGGSQPQYGVTLSPVLYKDWVLVAPQTKTVGLAALDKATGKVVWQSKPIGTLSNASPVVTTIDGVPQAVVQNGAGAHGVNLPDGQLLWSCDFKCARAIAQPTLIGDGRLFLTTVHPTACAMFKIEHQADAWKTTVLWHLPSHGSHVQAPLLIDHCLYLLGNSNEFHEGLVCLDLDGQEKWHTGQAPSLDKGNLLYADGRVWSMDGATGDLRILQPDPAGYQEIARAKLLSGPMVWGCMALADGRLLARDQKQLKCVDLRAPK